MKKTVETTPKNETPKHGAKLVLNAETLRRLNAAAPADSVIPLLPTQPPICST
jgi:hypothetical protein